MWFMHSCYSEVFGQVFVIEKINLWNLKVWKIGSYGVKFWIKVLLTLRLVPTVVTELWYNKTIITHSFKIWKKYWKALNMTGNKVWEPSSKFWHDTFFQRMFLKWCDLCTPAIQKCLDKYLSSRKSIFETWRYEKYEAVAKNFESKCY